MDEVDWTQKLARMKWMDADGCTGREDSHCMGEQTSIAPMMVRGPTEPLCVRRSLSHGIGQSAHIQEQHMGVIESSPEYTAVVVIVLEARMLQTLCFTT